METTARDFSQNASKILAAAERGERITVTKNGRPVAILWPVTEEPVPDHPTDPMGDDDIPVFQRLQDRLVRGPHRVPPVARRPVTPGLDNE
ncbi:type II toxin-antitoxin system Phd/YefM family antitoxin [Streptomyces sp. S-9]|uniref:type II toxin-antitoxin system Phd/YefM family antitoxin n=1 Tax=Streptomyces sp. S-9 TaxID=2806600 RepID=UPI00193B928D|nr:type II toxin-antitoxin system prevent-host-death family antitoxin [Streptomyces sp. S-9]